LGVPVVPEVKMSEATSSGAALFRNGPIRPGWDGSPSIAWASVATLGSSDCPDSARHSPARSCAASSERSTTRASLRRTMLTTSASLETGSTGTTVAPARRMPK
jgi:hypothetical protein